MSRRASAGLGACCLLCGATLSPAREQPAPAASSNRLVDRRGCIGDPAFDGKLDIEVDPASIKLGQPYALKVSLKNTGTRTMRLSSVEMLARINAQPGPTLQSSLVVKEVPVGERRLVAEGKGAWGDDVNVWVLLAKVTGDNGDTCQDRIALRQRR